MDKSPLQLVALAFLAGVYLALVVAFSSSILVSLALLVALVLVLGQETRRLQHHLFSRIEQLEKELAQANTVGKDLGKQLANARQQGLKWKNMFRLARNMQPTDLLDDS